MHTLGSIQVGNPKFKQNFCNQEVKEKDLKGENEKNHGEKIQHKPGKYEYVKLYDISYLSFEKKQL